jgi:hypothetical protein
MAIHKSSNWIGKNAPHFKDCVFFGPKKILIFNSMTSFVLTRLISIWRFYQYYTLRSGLHISPYFSIRLPQGDAVQVIHSPCFLKYPLGRPYFGIGSWNPLDLYILGPMRNITHTHIIYICAHLFDWEDGFWNSVLLMVQLKPCCISHSIIFLWNFKNTSGQQEDWTVVQASAKDSTLLDIKRGWLECPREIIYELVDWLRTRGLYYLIYWGWKPMGLGSNFQAALHEMESI